MWLSLSASSKSRMLLTKPAIGGAVGMGLPAKELGKTGLRGGSMLLGLTPTSLSGRLSAATRRARRHDDHVVIGDQDPGATGTRQEQIRRS